MRFFFVFVSIVLLPLYVTARCSSGCTCFSDDSCDYYCKDNVCQPSIPLWQSCSGYYVHQRECGTVSFCDPEKGFTCQLQKNWNEACTYSYSCLSGYCDTSSWTCQSELDPSRWVVPIFLPTVVGVTILIILLVLIIRFRVRRRALGYYRTPYVVIPSNTSACSYQNYSPVSESSPPPYPGVHTASTSKTYQN